jgi:oleate hydratase
VFVANGSITSDFSVGDHAAAASLLERPGNNWNLWYKLSDKFDDFGNPAHFVDRIRQTTVVSFTVTSLNKKFFELMEQLSSNIAGTGGLTTLTASNWQVSFCLPYQPYFVGQPNDVSVFWGYGLAPYIPGNFIKKPMIECCGEEILKELISHLNFSENQHKILKQATCRPLIFPYFTAPLLLTSPHDKPEIVPKGVNNMAFIGQFSHLGNYPSLSIEYSIRSARQAVYTLFKLG